MNTLQLLYQKFLQHPVICTDTRQLTRGCIFFALKGDNFNGNHYATKALEAGAAFAVIDDPVFATNAQFVLTDDVLTTMQQLAAHHRQQLNTPLFALTGSNGKTTTKELIAAVLSKKFNTLYTKGNLNNHIGVALTLLQLKKEHEFAVIEMGANHQKEIELLCTIAQPDFGLITNIGKAHLEGFGGFEGVKKGKGELYQYIKSKKGLLFVNGDNAVLNEVLGNYDKIITYGISATQQYAGNAATNKEFMMVHCEKPFALDIRTNLTGTYNFENVMAAVAIGNHFGVLPEDIKTAIENYFPSNQRSQVIQKENHVTIVLDAYNANPSSMNAALENFEKNFSGEKIVALGDMLELGDSSEKEHFAIAEKLSMMKLNHIVTVGPNFEKPAKQFGFRHFVNATLAYAWFKSMEFKNTTLLIKGSRGIKMELIAEAFS